MILCYFILVLFYCLLTRTLLGEIKSYFWIATLLLLFYRIKYYNNLNIALLDTWEGIYDSLFQSLSIISSFDLFLCIIKTRTLLQILYYPDVKKKINGINGKENIFFLFNQYNNFYCFTFFIYLLSSFYSILIYLVYALFKKNNFKISAAQQRNRWRIIVVLGE
jgi:hypothetical protein